MNMRNIGLLSGIVVVLLSAGCARYHAQPINRVINTSAQPKQSVALAYKLFDQNDCKTYLGRDILSKGYQPINITLYNNTNRSITVSKSGFSLPCIPATEIAKKVHTSTFTRVAAYGITGLFLWPFLIPAVVDGVGSSQANHKLDEDFMRKEFADQVIAPYASASGIIFVPRSSFIHDFKFTVYEAENREPLVLSTSKRLVALNG